MTTSPLRSETLDLRLTPGAKQTLQRAAAAECRVTDFLLDSALANQRARASRSYVALAGDALLGFHTLVVDEVGPEQAPERIRKGLARHPMPLMVLAHTTASRA